MDKYCNLYKPRVISQLLFLHLDNVLENKSRTKDFCSPERTNRERGGYQRIGQVEQNFLWWPPDIWMFVSDTKQLFVQIPKTQESMVIGMADILPIKITQILRW